MHWKYDRHSIYSGMGITLFIEIKKQHESMIHSCCFFLIAIASVIELYYLKIPSL